MLRMKRIGLIGCQHEKNNEWTIKSASFLIFINVIASVPIVSIENGDIDSTG